MQLPPKKPISAKSPTVTDLDAVLLDKTLPQQPQPPHEEDPDIMTMEDIFKSNNNASYKSLFMRRVIPYSGGHIPAYKLDQQAVQQQIQIEPIPATDEEVVFMIQSSQLYDNKKKHLANWRQTTAAHVPPIPTVAQQIQTIAGSSVVAQISPRNEKQQKAEMVESPIRQFEGPILQHQAGSPIIHNRARNFIYHLDTLNSFNSNQATPTAKKLEQTLDFVQYCRHQEDSPSNRISH